MTAASGQLGGLVEGPDVPDARPEVPGPDRGGYHAAREMSLSAGTRLGPYEVLAPLGAGGMGEVYRARDTRLQRTVALKVIHAEVAGDPGRRARFEREARAVSSLNHPHICALFDVGQEKGVDFLVMEHVEGETLAERLAGGRLSLDQTLRLGAQMAEALDAAHRQGVVHRDLKPGNVMLAKSGVKLLDFGLAKLRPDAEATPGESTLTRAREEEPLTGEGVVMGTVPYMAPEQLEGKAADARTDTFALGAMLHEMATGQRAFDGESRASLIAAILKHDPPAVSSLQPLAPPGFDRAVKMCLAKDPDERWQSARDLAAELRWLAEAGSPAGAKPLKATSATGALGRGAALLAAGALLGGAVAVLRQPRASPEPPSLRHITHSGNDWNAAASPDGKTVAFVSDRDGSQRIWLKQLADGSEVALTSGPDDRPRFTPDGSGVLFARMTPGSGAALYRVPVVGGEPRRLVENAREGDPSPDGSRLVFTRPSEDSRGSALWTASADGTAARRLVEFPPDVFAMSPRWSPDGRLVAAVGDRGASTGPSDILLVDVGRGTWKAVPGHWPTVIWFALDWNGNGREILYTQSNSLTARNSTVPGWVVRHDVARGRSRTILSLPRPAVMGGVLRSGQLLLQTETARQTLREVPFSGGRALSGHRLSGGVTSDRQPAYGPDGTSIVFSSSRDGNLDIWQVWPATGALRRLTDHPRDDWDPALISGGRQLVWSSNRSGNFEIWIAAADGSGARQLSRDGRNAENPTATPDGAWIFYACGAEEKQGLWKIRADGTEATRLVTGDAVHPETSPDGRFVVYFASSSGKKTLHVVRTADGKPAPFTIAGLDDWRARWRPDGRALVFRSRDDSGRWGLFVQDFVPGADTTSTRRPLAGFDPRLELETFGISPDGSRLALAEVEWGSSLLVASGLEGIEPPRQGRGGPD
jgi:serine/threonine protein kinase